jgi:hypothetical protein
MPKRRHTEERIIAVLQEVEAGARGGKCLSQDGDQRGHALSLEEAVFRREMRQLREEKALVADLSMDRHILLEIVSKKL